LELGVSEIATNPMCINPINFTGKSDGRHRFYINPSAWQKVYTWLKTPNTTVTFELTTPDYNDFIGELANLPSWGGAAFYTMIAVETLVFVVIAIKWATFFVFEKGLRFSLPQIVFALCAYSTFWGWLSAVFGPLSLQGKLDQRFGTIILTWPQPPVFGACLVLAFYFKEISVLSSQKGTLSALDYFRVPAFVLIGSIFIVDYVCDALIGSRLGTLSITQIFTIQMGFYAAIYFVVIVVMLWGMLALVFAMRDMAGKHRGLIARVVVLTCVNVIAIASLSWFWANSLVPYSSNNYNEYGGLFVAMAAPAVMCLTLCFNFRIEVQQEIEISKSGTSSTSSSGSSSSSKSSSADPVIEL